MILQSFIKKKILLFSCVHFLISGVLSADFLNLSGKMQERKIFPISF